MYRISLLDIEGIQSQHSPSPCASDSPHLVHVCHLTTEIDLMYFLCCMFNAFPSHLQVGSSILCLLPLNFSVVVVPVAYLGSDQSGFEIIENLFCSGHVFHLCHVNRSGVY